MGNNTYPFVLFTAIALLIGLVAAELSAGNEGGEGDKIGTTTASDNNKLAKVVKIFSIPSWSSYMQFFNKRYSSISQQLIRQKLFIARAIEVFLTRIKYKLSQLSYYTAINEYSDSTPDESGRKLSGDSDDDNDDELELDDEEARKLLLDMLNERNQIEKEEQEVSRKRKRRSPSDNEENPSANGNEPNKIRWRVPSENPDYEPIHVNELTNQQSMMKERIIDDIPADRAKEIEIATKQDRYKLAEIASGGFGRVKNIVGGAMEWLSPSDDTEEEDDDEVVKNKIETVVVKDWRQSGCIGPVRNQGDCLSCYAVSAIGFMEWALCRAHDNQLTPLSVQYMISCGPQYKQETGGRIKLDGCNQGASRQTADFIREYGIELEANMPYLERDTSCPLEAHTPRKRKGYFRPNTKPVIRLKPKTTQLDLALETGPVIVGMREPKNFLAYGGGMVEHCYQQGGHAMLIVGSMIENGVEYLLIKNSFGTSWGYDGYFKFKRSSILECVKEFIVLRVNFPGKKAQARRIKAYLANNHHDGRTNSNDEIQEEFVDANIFA